MSYLSVLATLAAPGALHASIVETPDRLEFIAAIGANAVEHFLEYLVLPVLPGFLNSETDSSYLIGAISEGEIERGVTYSSSIGGLVVDLGGEFDGGFLRLADGKWALKLTFDKLQKGLVSLRTATHLIFR